MKTTLKIAALVNAIILTAAFVVCPACKGRGTDLPLMPLPISTHPVDFERFVPEITPLPVDAHQVLRPCEKAQRD